MKRLPILLILIVAALACQQDPTDSWEELDLMSYGIPVSIQAPDSAQVRVKDLIGNIKDVTVKAGEDYSIQLYTDGAETTDIAKIKAEQLSQVKSNVLFSRIVEEEEDGFIYETKIDTLANYSFRYILVQGDLECVFQTGMVGQFTLEEVKNMYNAVKKGS